MLGVATLQHGDPLPPVVLVKADDTAVDRRGGHWVQLVFSRWGVVTTRSP